MHYLLKFVIDWCRCTQNCQFSQVAPMITFYKITMLWKSLFYGTERLVYCLKIQARFFTKNCFCRLLLLVKGFFYIWFIDIAFKKYDVHLEICLRAFIEAPKHNLMNYFTVILLILNFDMVYFKSFTKFYIILGFCSIIERY